MTHHITQRTGTETRGNKMFAVNARPKLQPGNSKKPQPPKYVLQYSGTVGNIKVWHETESPYTITLTHARLKLNQHVQSPLRRYLQCRFRIVRLGENRCVVTERNHKSVKA